MWQRLSSLGRSGLRREVPRGWCVEEAICDDAQLTRRWSGQANTLRADAKSVFAAQLYRYAASPQCDRQSCRVQSAITVAELLIERSRIATVRSHDLVGYVSD